MDELADGFSLHKIVKQGLIAIVVPIDSAASDVRRAICRQMGWPSSEGKMVKMADTFAFLILAGITKVKIIGDAETVDVELEKGGRCRKTP